MQWRYIWIMFDFFGWPWAAICLFARMKKNGTHMERCSALRCRSKRRGHPPAGFFLAFLFGSSFSLLCYAALFGRLAIGTLFSFQTERESETPQKLRRLLFMTFLDVSYSYFLFVSIWHSLESVMATGYELSEGWQIMRARSCTYSHWDCGFFYKVCMTWGFGEKSQRDWQRTFHHVCSVGRLERHTSVSSLPRQV